MSSSHKEREDVYVILRADVFHRANMSLDQLITVKEVVRSADIAEREVERLNGLHPDGEVRYWSAHSRLFPAGRSASSVAEPA